MDESLQKKSLYDRKMTKGMQKKLAVWFIIILLAFIVLGVVLIRIVKDRGDKYAKKVLSQQVYDAKIIPYRRGSIVDAGGNILAISKQVYNLILDTKVMRYNESDKLHSLEVLCTAFDLDKNEIESYMNSHVESQYYVLKKNISYDAMASFSDMMEEDEHIRGLWFEPVYDRDYPYGSLACDVIGYMNSDGNGINGLEEYYNEYLTGINGRDYGYLNSDLNLERTRVEATDGAIIHSTIDITIQNTVEKYIKQFLEEYRDAYRPGAGATNMGCIVMNPKNGKVLAMADSTSYDLNNPRDLSGYYTDVEVENLKNDGLYTDALNKMWRNFCISDTYEPGSVGKTLTIATGLDSGKLTGNEKFTCDGALQVANHLIHCNLHRGHGTLTVKEALEVSCNVCLMEMADRIGKDDFLKYENIFNIGLRTNIDLVGEARTDALVFTDKTMGVSELATSSFGQGYNVTMIQMASAVSSLINGGYLYQPHLVSYIENSEGAVIKEFKPRVLKQTISNETSEIMKDYMIGVVSEGTGGSACPAGYEIGGKTGTAEKVPRDKTNYVVSFIGFAPIDDPEVLIYVVIDEPNSKDQPHSYYATGVVRQILTEILPYLNVEKTKEMSEEDIAELVQLGLYYMDTQTGELYDEETGELIEQEWDSSTAE